MIEPATADTPTLACCATTQLCYLTAGTGSDAVVLLHGWGSFKEIWWSAMLALAPFARSFAPDQPGHGGSPLHTSHTLDQVATRIADFCAARQLESISLVGHSMGGNIALRLALARPDLVRRLVLVAPAVEVRALPVGVRRPFATSAGWARLRLGMATARLVGRLSHQVAQTRAGSVVRSGLRRAAYWGRNDPEAMQRLFDSMLAPGLARRAVELALPTLIISGAFDPMVAPAHSAALAASIAGARYAVVPWAGHTPMEERPARFEALLGAFLGYT